MCRRTILAGMDQARAAPGIGRRRRPARWRETVPPLRPALFAGAREEFGCAARTVCQLIAVAMAMSVTTACVFAPWSDPVPDVAHAEAALGHPLTLASGQVRSLDHPDFERSAADRALWAPLGMLEKGDAGIFFLQPYDPERIPVLFVPGIGGTPRDFRRMIESLDSSRFQAWVFNYPSGFRAESIVDLLHDVLDEIAQKYCFDTLFMTAHSLGGLISYSYIKAGLPETERVKVLVTFSSPWMGYSWAAVGTQNMTSPVPSWSDLSPGSNFLISLREPTPRDTHAPLHFVFFGYQRHTSLLTTESSDGLISIASQLPPWVQDRAERYWGFNATHVGLLSDDAALKRYNELLAYQADAVLPHRLAPGCPRESGRDVRTEPFGEQAHVHPHQAPEPSASILAGG